MKVWTIGLFILVFLCIGGAGVCATEEATVESPQVSVDNLLQQGPGLLAEGNYQQVLDLILALPAQERNDIRVRCLECFANLSGWRIANIPLHKAVWQELRMKLLYVGDNEVTPLLAILLKDTDPFVREYAAELLGYIGDTRALDALQEAAKNDDNRGVRKYAKWAHKQIARGLTPATAVLAPLAAPHVEIPVTMDTAGPIATDKSITIVNGTMDFKIVCLGFFDFKKYYADLELWTDVIVDQLETELQKRGVRVMTPGGPCARKAVIGVLNMESDQAQYGNKKTLIEKIEQKPLASVVDIPAYNSLSDLLTNGYEKADGFKSTYQVDMLLHVSQGVLDYNFSLIDLQAKKVYTESVETKMGMLDEITALQLSKTVLANRYLNRVLRTKKKSAAIAGEQAASAGDRIFSIWVQQASVAEGAVSSRCTGTVLVQEEGGPWSKTYTFYNVGSSIERAISGAAYRAVEAMLKDPAFRRALSR